MRGLVLTRDVEPDEAREPVHDLFDRQAHFVALPEVGQRLVEVPVQIGTAKDALGEVAAEIRAGRLGAGCCDARGRERDPGHGVWGRGTGEMR